MAAEERWTDGAHALADAVPLVVGAYGPRLGFRPNEVADLLGVSKDLVDSWIDSGAAPRAALPGNVRVVPAWWIQEALHPGSEPAPRRALRSADPAAAAAHGPRDVLAPVAVPAATKTEHRRKARQAPWSVPRRIAG